MGPDFATRPLIACQTARMTKTKDANAQSPEDGGPEDGVVKGDNLLEEAAGGMNDHGVVMMPVDAIPDLDNLSRN